MATTLVSVVRNLLVFILSVAFAVACTAILAAVADARNWCCVHGWALMHGSGIVVLMLFGLLGYHLISIIGGRLKLLAGPQGFGWLAHATYIGAALGTLFFTQYFLWPGLVAGLSALALRLRGHIAPRFGMAMFGLVVCLLLTAQWIFRAVYY